MGPLVGIWESVYPGASVRHVLVLFFRALLPPCALATQLDCSVDEVHSYAWVSREQAHVSLSLEGGSRYMYTIVEAAMRDAEERKDARLERSARRAVEELSQLESDAVQARARSGDLLLTIREAGTGLERKALISDDGAKISLATRYFLRQWAKL